METIYKAFGGKRGLVRAIWDQGLAGSGPVQAELPSDEMLELEVDPRKVIENWGALTMEVAPRTAPILLLIRTAAVGDSEMVALQQEVGTPYADRTQCQPPPRRGDLREGVNLEQARDVLWTYSSPELYDLLVLRLGWPLERYGRFVAEGMIAALLPALPGVTDPVGADGSIARTASRTALAMRSRRAVCEKAITWLLVAAGTASQNACQVSTK